jgi:hypothetical protein
MTDMEMLRDDPFPAKAKLAWFPVITPGRRLKKQ